MTTPGDPVTYDQQLLAARRVALQNLREAEIQVVKLAGWIGAYPNWPGGMWRDPMNGRDTSTADALAKIRTRIDREWAPPKSESLI